MSKNDLRNWFDRYFLETAQQSLARPCGLDADHISIWIEEYPHSTEDSFIVCGQYCNEDESFTISDLHSEEGANDYMRKLKVMLPLIGMSWVLKPNVSHC